MPYKFLVFSLSFIYAVFLTSLPVDVFADRYNYMVYAASSDSILLGYQVSGWLTVLVNEPVWLIMNILLGGVFLPDTCLRIFIFSSSFILSISVMKKYPNQIFWLVIFIVVPLFIKNYIIHLRQGVAISIFISGYLSDRKYLKWSAIGIAPFIHSSFFIVYIVVSLGLGYISSSLGARQADDMQGFDVGGSGFAFVFWLMILTIYLSASRSFIVDNSFSISSVILYVCSYFITPYSGRIFESSIMVVMLTGLQLNGVRKYIFLSMICAFTAFDYFTRLSMPLFGWGAQ